MIQRTSTMAGMSIPEPLDGAFHPASTPDYLPARADARTAVGSGCAPWCAAPIRKVALFRERLDERSASLPEDIRDSARYRAPALHHQEPICATPIRSACSPAPWRTSCGCTPRAAPPASPSWWPTRAQDLDVWTSVMVRAFAACGLHSRRHRAERLRLRPVHRRSGRALRRRIAGRHRHPRLRRQYRPADHGDEGFPRHRHLLHAQLLHPPAGARRGAGRRMSATCPCAWASSAPSRGPNPCAATSRSRAAFRPSISTASPRSSGRAWPSSARFTTACTSSRTISTRRSWTRRRGARAARGRRGRAGAHHAQQAGHADDPLPHARHHLARRRSRAPAAAPSAAWPASAAAATTCSSSAASTSSPRRSRPRCWRSKARCRTTRSSSRARRGSTRMEVQVEVTPEVFSDKIGALEALHDRLGVRAGTDPGAARGGHAGRAAQHPAQRGQSPARDRPPQPGARYRMKIHQLSLFLENKPGQMTAPCRLLAAAGSTSAPSRWPIPSASASCA